jgi:hypothetical protein
MADENRILGDIRPRTKTSEEDRDKPMVGGSEHDRPEHPRARDVTEGSTGTGAARTDIGTSPSNA